MTKLSKFKAKNNNIHHNPSPVAIVSGESNKSGNIKSPNKREIGNKRRMIRAFTHPPHRCCHHHYHPYGENVSSESGYGLGSAGYLPSLSPESGLGIYRIRRPWWLWAIGFIDIILVFVVAYSVSFTVLEEGFPLFVGRGVLMFILLLFSSLVQFSMGTGLICGLFSEDDFTTASCLQGWLYGAYFILLKTTYFLFVDMAKLKAVEEAEDSVGDELGTILGNCIGILRVIAVIMVQKYLDEFRASSCAIIERDLHNKLREVLMERIQDQKTKELYEEYYRRNENGSWISDDHRYDLL